mmetsp:Transcript_58846/g.182808  ORF Transcript_58846/g.182808 Transcript_58846/m.182808 type:complete len:204 (-) Transcript_58846:1132-1743(-)
MFLASKPNVNSFSLRSTLASAPSCIHRWPSFTMTSVFFRSREPCRGAASATATICSLVVSCAMTPPDESWTCVTPLFWSNHNTRTRKFTPGAVLGVSAPICLAAALCSAAFCSGVMSLMDSKIFPFLCRQPNMPPLSLRSRSAGRDFAPARRSHRHMARHREKGVATSLYTTMGCPLRRSTCPTQSPATPARPKSTNSRMGML